MFNAANTRPLSREEEVELFARWRAGDKDAGGRLISAQYRWVVKKARKQAAKHGLDYDDLVSSGLSGAHAALEKFDPKKGFRFLTYATWWVKSYMDRCVYTNLSSVSRFTTTESRRLFGSIQPAREELRKKLGRAPDDDELAEYLNTDVESISRAKLLFTGRDVSMSTPIGGNSGELTIEDTLRGSWDQSEMVEEKQAADQLSAHVEEALKILDPREREIIEKRLMSDRPEKLLEIGGKMGVSRERIRQVEIRAIGKLREALKHTNPSEYKSKDQIRKKLRREEKEKSLAEWTAKRLSFKEERRAVKAKVQEERVKAIREREAAWLAQVKASKPLLPREEPKKEPPAEPPPALQIAKPFVPEYRPLKHPKQLEMFEQFGKKLGTPRRRRVASPPLKPLHAPSSIPRRRMPPHPLDVLREEFLVDRGSAAKLAVQLGVKKQKFYNYIRGKSPVTLELAKLLASAFGTTEQFWINLQVNYDQAKLLRKTG